MTLTLALAGLAVAVLAALALVLAAALVREHAALVSLERRHKLLELAHGHLLVEHERLLGRVEPRPFSRN